MPAALLARIYLPSVALAAGAPREVDLELNGARSWSIVVKNTGANPMTAATLKRSPLGALFGPAESLPAGVPLAAGESLVITGSEPLTTLRLTLTSSSGTSLHIEGGG